MKNNSKPAEPGKVSGSATKSKNTDLNIEAKAQEEAEAKAKQEAEAKAQEEAEAKAKQAAEDKGQEKENESEPDEYQEASFTSDDGETFTFIVKDFIYKGSKYNVQDVVRNRPDILQELVNSKTFILKKR